jgi:serine/threonine protein kinase
LSEKDVVIKLESVKGEHLTIKHKFHVYKKLGCGIGMPHVHWFGTEASFNAIVIDSLGQSLKELFTRCNFRFSIKTVLLLACQLVSEVQISHLQYINSHGFIHHALKLSNFVMGVSKHANIVYLIDFGLSKEFRDPNTHMHIPHKEAISLMGTAMFASIHSHLGMGLGRYDDLESFAYILIYFLHGSLPWQGLDYQSCNHVAESKQETSTFDLCHRLPVKLHALLDYSHSLSFNDKPDYGYLSCLFDEWLLQEVSSAAMFN